MTITLNLRNLIYFVSVLAIVLIVGNLAMDAFSGLNEVAHQYSVRP
jgi:hypothetical protein